MVEKLFESLMSLDEVEAIALGGSRAGENFDEKSDYDVYLYTTKQINESVRKELLSQFCDYMEIGNHFWELEDNCTLKNGIDIDILYRNIADFSADVASVVEECNARNGYTTCMWHNLLTCKIIYDKEGKLQALKDRFSVPYPEKLRANIVRQNMRLLSDNLPSYDLQIKKALKRNDIVSMNHRTSAFLESYFDIIFAINKMTHPGEKRLVELCKKNCEILPENFEENLGKLLYDLYSDSDLVAVDLTVVINELKKIVDKYLV